MINLLIIGVGYVGLELVRKLEGKPYKISLTTTKEERVPELSKLSNSVLVLKEDHDEELKKYIEEADAIVILAAPGKGKTYEETYLGLAKRISHATKERKRALYLLYTSSTSVCEGVDSAFVTETSPLNPFSENGKTLLETEKTYLQNSAKSCILRLGGIYGPGRELVKRASRFSGLEMADNGDKPTNNIHLDDIVSAIIFCLERGVVGIYHLVADDHPSRLELYNALCRSIQIPVPLWGSKKNQKNEKGYKISNQKIKELGFLFKYPNVL